MSPTTEEVRTLTDDELHGVSGGHLIQDFVDTVNIAGSFVIAFLEHTVYNQKDPWA